MKAHPKYLKPISQFISFTLILLSTSLCLAGSSLTFGVYTSDKASTMYKTFNPVLKALAKSMTASTGQETSIKIKIYKNYQEGINGLSRGEVDFMRMGPASYILAKEKNPEIQLLAMEIRKGKKTFKGVIITPSDSEITQLSQLKGKSFAFGNKNSTIGRYLAQAELMDAGIYGKDLHGFDFLGRHDKVAFSVGLGDYDAGSVKEKTFNKMSKKNNIKALAYFDNITKPWVASDSIDKHLFDALNQALLSLDDAATLKLLKVDSFAPAQDSDYDFVRTGMLKARKF